MIEQPFFDRWRAKLIATLEPGSVGELDTIRFAPVAATVAVVCPFLRFDGEPCEQLITYYLHVGSGIDEDPAYALGACHRHLGHAFDVLFAADRIGLADACDDDAVDASAAAPPARPSTSLEDAELAQRLISEGFLTAADFGTTALDEGFPSVSGAHVTFAAHLTERLREGGVLELAADLGANVSTAENGAVTIATPEPDSADEWIAQNRALRELVHDAAENSVDPVGYRYRTIADALPEPVDFEPHVFTAPRSGTLAVGARIAATPAERTWDASIDPGVRHTLQLHVDRLPRPGDYLDISFALYRFVRVWPEGEGYGADTVLERINQPSRN